MSAELIDTMLNLTVFAYVGVLVWMWLRPDP